MKFDLSMRDFTLHEQKAKALKVWIDPEFQRFQQAAGNVIPRQKNAVLRTKTARLKLHDSPTEICYDPDAVKDEAANIESINAFLNYLESSYEDIRRTIARSLTEVYNKHWRRCDDTPLTETEMMRRLGNLKVINYSKSRITMYWDDNGLFGNHEIEVTMRKLKVNEVLIAG
jgi:hypothetical protein